METFIVYFDDADWALRQIEPLIGRSDGALPSAQWVLVACPPRLGRHAGRWVTRAVRESDRSERAGKLFDGVTPWLQARGESLVYRVRILERGGHLITVGIDAVSRRIMAPGDT